MRGRKNETRQTKSQDIEKNTGLGREKWWFYVYSWGQEIVSWIQEIAEGSQ